MNMTVNLVIVMINLRVDMTNKKYLMNLEMMMVMTAMLIEMSNLERMMIVMMKMMMKPKVILILGVQNALDVGNLFT